MGFACLVPITGYTGTNHIFPDVLTASIPRDNMVYGKLAGFLPTILASVAVTVKNFKASQLPLVPGALNHVVYSDY
jgi:hypothetical protein